MFGFDRFMFLMEVMCRTRLHYARNRNLISEALSKAKDRSQDCNVNVAARQWCYRNITQRQNNTVEKVYLQNSLNY